MPVPCRFHGMNTVRVIHVKIVLFADLLKVRKAVGEFRGCSEVMEFSTYSAYNTRFYCEALLQTDKA
uniref:Uncharacterized protein n=1 Tax=Candidatus Kentrum sp. MB TaxID=2138164 RepID=A0A450WYV0_9GAMM|nr:MAG: hypothetical protein BECKMB1821G_GA0114241_100199 [Candidatus Kentron sp. MB]VFK32617.1 MAG: hypothetical protein BECKMB1821I_GA0114274_103519 [Candidatus Kentron sp. MB]VFK75999.1 MAG: hypothetical protein BECKMB1821H_GA0114242_103818 [Candidatus Kentron sp. MB]